MASTEEICRCTHALSVHSSTEYDTRCKICPGMGDDWPLPGCLAFRARAELSPVGSDSAFRRRSATDDLDVFE
jgi:hypothetical protein